MVAFQWLNDLLYWVGSFFPRIKVVRSTHKGVRFKWGKNPILINPGICVYWPIVTNITLIPVVRQTTQLQPQVLTTADGKTVAVSAVFVYRISNPFLAITETDNIYGAADDIAQTALAEVITLNRQKELFSTKHCVEIQLEELLRKRLGPLGLELDYASIIEVGSTFVLRNIGDAWNDNPGLRGALFESE